ncbi:RING-type domain-containing protein, partial [Durusdinium trenchii]
VRVAVVPCTVPLLLSRPVLARLGMTYDLAAQSASLKALQVDLVRRQSSPTGHPALIVNVYTREGFNPSYFTASHRRQVVKWLGEVPAGSKLEESEKEVEDPGLDTGRGGQPLSKEGVVEGRKVVLKTPKRASRASALRSAPAAALRARGKGVSGGDKPSEGGPLGDRVNAGPADRAFSDFPQDLELGTEGERDQMSTEEL